MRRDSPGRERQEGVPGGGCSIQRGSHVMDLGSLVQNMNT